MPFRRFLVWNATGGFVWGAVVVILGYAAGASYARVETLLGRGVTVVVLGVVIAGLVVWRIRRHRGSRPRPPGQPESASPSWQ